MSGERDETRQRRRFFRNPGIPIRSKIIAIGVPAFVGCLVVFLLGSAVVSHEINAQRETRTCTMVSLGSAGRPLLDGKPSWKVVTSCGGTLYIDPDATHQSGAAATTLAESLTPAQSYVLTIQGELGNAWAISSYLLAARPSA
jgi:hypothetical protein